MWGSPPCRWWRHASDTYCIFSPIIKCNNCPQLLPKTARKAVGLSTPAPWCCIFNVDFVPNLKERDVVFIDVHISFPIHVYHIKKRKTSLSTFL